ncbi:MULTISPECIES: type II toxin-antitoxin system PemK/MazF family toxin [unclassified Rhizobium]|uniref:type II toxin-antitoxin system PemK/MazF family toxin n=1 Tax=unclassified Rhizobium TaxID=2613769 RepID=UPI0007142B5E|nr:MULTISPECIES: type II toxin-antitoxin system PemK/MazF family toxin [unclassified Rhizobium]KQS83254.1 growth inhibitor PemK [Rhizobium sp. Leaf386]KQS88858.1 growth inhibitor PemK [Rhizobium sp. Leaf391]KQT92705.1 growth inhibitor PemK [Rhizobium sp. Leaf453]
MVKRGEVWLAGLDPTVGSEIQKTRPCLIISPMEIHDYLRTVIVAPMTSGSRPAGFRVPVTFQGVSGLILLEQARALDKQRLVKRLGSVSDSVLRQTLKTLRELYEE